ncbi:DUF3105 domain-containing protein [Micromonospora globbae]|uniref:DUF3105 domain-containing protein n=1 Tax=Micromonospora globbae TaxID=1894969 RepID=UPI00342AC7ED
MKNPKSPARGRNANALTVRTGRPWGVIAVVSAVSVLALSIIGYAAISTWLGSRPWEQRLTEVSGVVDYASEKPAWLTSEHESGPLTYEVTPSAGGSHNRAWQNRNGDVYDAPIAAEQATHSMEHGAVWVTYRPDLPAEQVQSLASRVRGVDYMLLSPHDNLDAPISLQAWGYRLVAMSPDDERIDEFIRAARVNAGLEQGATCAGGVTATGPAIFLRRDSRNSDGRGLHQPRPQNSLQRRLGAAGGRWPPLSRCSPWDRR